MELSALLAQTEFDSLNDDTRDELEALQFTLSEGEVTALHVDAAAASVALHVRIGVPDWPAANVRVTFRTDARYPEQHACSFEIDGSDIIREQVLNELTERLQQTSEELLGSPALLCLIENVREFLAENSDRIASDLKAQKASLWDDSSKTARVVDNNDDDDASSSDDDGSDDSEDSSQNEAKNAKAEQRRLKGMSKAQKRAMWKNMDGSGKRERGYNWVDIISHLSKTGTGK